MSSDHTAHQMLGKVRALTKPSSGAYFTGRGANRLYVWEAEVYQTQRKAPKPFYVEDITEEGIFLTTKEDVLCLQKVGIGGLELHGDEAARMLDIKKDRKFLESNSWRLVEKVYEHSLDL